MPLRLLSRVLQHLTVLCAAPPFMHAMYGVEKWPGIFPRVDLRWVSEPRWVALTAMFGIAAVVTSLVSARLPKEWGGTAGTTGGFDAVSRGAHRAMLDSYAYDVQQGASVKERLER